VTTAYRIYRKSKNANPKRNDQMPGERSGNFRGHDGFELADAPVVGDGAGATAAEVVVVVFDSLALVAETVAGAAGVAVEVVLDTFVVVAEPAGCATSTIAPAAIMLSKPIRTRFMLLSR
jgi:hypothetical protein